MKCLVIDEADRILEIGFEQQMKDISTSYCFICLLHLANEKGLVLDGGREETDNGGDGMREIRVRKDESVGIGYVGE